jgi:hypothetical protein
MTVFGWAAEVSAEVAAVFAAQIAVFAAQIAVFAAQIVVVRGADRCCSRRRSLLTY